MDCSIHTSQYANVLGVVFPSDLKLNIHFDKFITKTRRCMYFIRRLKKIGSSRNSLIAIYNAVVRSVMCYCCVLLSNRSISNFNRLEQMEKRFFKVIGGQPAVAIKDFCQSNIDRMISDVLKFDDHPLRQLLVTNSTVYHTRASDRRISLSPAVHPKTERYRSFVRFFMP